MANVGTGASGNVLTGTGNGTSPTFQAVGTNSGLSAHGVLLAEGNSPFTVATPGTAGNVLASNGASSDPSFQTIASLGGITTITGNSGGAEVPSTGNFNILGTGSITVAGSANTETVQLTGLTNHNVQVGAGTATLTQVAPSSTSGIPLVSNGSSSDPSFTTAVVAGGGTGRTTLTNHGILVGAGTSAITQLATGSAGQIIRSGGAGADPSYSTATYPDTAGTSGNVLTSDGTNWNSTAPASAIGTINGDSGSVTGSTVTVRALNGGKAGQTVQFVGSGSTMNLNLVDGSDNITIGRSAGNGSISGFSNVGLGTAVFLGLTSGVQNACLGQGSLQAVSSGQANTACGYNALATLSTNSLNCAFGYSAGAQCTGSNNAAFGATNLGAASTGSNNTAIGYASLPNLGNGSYNICLGQSSGVSYNGTESSNICIGNNGTNGESHTLRIGTAGSGNGQVSTCYIAGISGVTVSNSATVLINTSTGQLGTVASSARYKEEIEDIPENESILKLRPVKFVYKQTKEYAYGLIAEEVEKIMPQLVVYDQQGNPDSVKYHELPALLLAEIQRLYEIIEEMQGNL